MKWNKVDELMPDPDDDRAVLIYRESDGWLAVADWFQSRFYIYESDEAHAVSHWADIEKPKS